MRKLWTTFLKDARISFRGMYFYIEVVIAVVFLLVMLFVVPEEFDRRQTLFLRVDLAEPARSDLISGIGSGDAIVEVFDSLDAMKAAMAGNRSAIGLDVGMDGGRLGYEVLLQGYEGEDLRRLFRAGLIGGLMAEMDGFEERTRVTTLEASPDRLTDREYILPVYLTMNVALIGLFIIAAYVFLDKEEGVIKAFAVAPAEVWQYLASKMMIMLMVGLASSVLTVLVLVGAEVDYLLLVGLVAASNLFGSALGLFISSFFDTMVKAMGVLYAVMMGLMTASLAYFLPAFNPLWLRWLPTYPMMFSFRELLLRDGDTAYVLVTTAVFFVLAALVFLAAVRRFRKTLTV